MFKRHAKSSLTDFRLVGFRLRGFRSLEPLRVALRGAGFVDTPSNDNLSGLRHPKGRRRIPSPALACHWINRHGRLECRWQVEPSGDLPIGDFDEHGAFGQPPMQPRGRRLALAG